jgi:hypothetical protein
LNKKIEAEDVLLVKTRWKKLRLKEVVLLSILSILLLIGAWLVFSEKTSTTYTASTDTEKRLVAILEKIEGVGEVDVMLSDTEDGERGAVIVCEGANDIRVLISVREAAATALGVQQKNVKIYLKKD